MCPIFCKLETNKQKKMSISDEKLSQMIKDYIEIGSTAPDSYLFTPSQDDDHNPTYSTLKEIMEETLDAEAEIYSKITLYLKDNKSMDNKLNILKKWIVYKLETDNYEAHLCQTSWSTPFAQPKVFKFRGDLCQPSCFAPFAQPEVFEFRGEYEYVEVMMREKDGGEMRVIVDIDFRKQFAIARATPSYQEVINALPLVFVGTEEKLKKLISLISSAAKQSLKETGLHFPPWRSASYMHSKWLSQNCKRLSFPQSNFQKMGTFNL